MLPLGTKAPPFVLPEVDGRVVKLGDFAGKPGLLVMFLCNHCPYVKHVQAELVRLAADFLPRGLGIVAINSNDPVGYPDDSPDKMRDEKERAGYPFPYLFDESQEVAKAYQAACTPDFFLFDRSQSLVYRGQLDDSRPRNELPVDGKDLREAIENLLQGKQITPHQKPSLGCNIKWKPGREPAWFQPPLPKPQ
jgi:peroxiredoxin